MKPFEWIEAASLDAALGHAAQGATPKAGGIDLLDLMKEGLAAPGRIVSLRGIGELQGIRDEGDRGLRIGAGATLEQVATHPAVKGRYPALAQAAATSASLQIRNAATLGGNLLQRPRCWYFRSLAHPCARKGGDTCFAFGGDNRHHAIFGQNGCAIVHPSTPATALVALGARLEIAAPGGARRDVALEDFLVGPERDIHRENELAAGQIVVAIHLPGPSGSGHSAHVRASEVASFDWPIADVAVMLDLLANGICRRASIVLGSAAPVPWRAHGAESALEGKRVNAALAAAAGREAVADARPLSHNAHKVPIFEALVRGAILAAARGA
ncbi:MAG TPA: FAD binding domain-containing protein [Usitatibacter sp.]|nr:FAD binding domain-containing protein [Usitatibacter sp.]